MVYSQSVGQDVLALNCENHIYGIFYCIYKFGQALVKIMYGFCT